MLRRATLSNYTAGPLWGIPHTDLTIS